MLSHICQFDAVLVGPPGDAATRLRTRFGDSHVVIEGESRTAGEAVRRLGSTCDKPRLLVVQPPNELESVRELREAFADWPILALAGSDQTSGHLLALNRAGADQVVASPPSQSDLEAALEQISRRHRPPAPRAPLTIAVCGAVPGAGVSSLSAALAAEIAFGYRTPVVLFEAALQMGVQAINLNVRPTTTLADLLTGAGRPEPEQVQKALVRVAPQLQLLAAPPDVLRSAQPGTQGVLQALAATQQLASVVIVDTACNYDNLEFDVLFAAHQLVIVGAQTLPSVRNTQLVLDAVARVHPPKRTHVVINRYDPAVADLSADVVSRALEAEVRTVPADAAVVRAAISGRMLRFSAPRSPVTAAIAGLAQAATGRAQTARARSLLSRLVATFWREEGEPE